MRRKKLIANTASAILSQVITLIFGFIIPRLVISNYGSNVNGLLSSITQFLAFFSMMEMGVGAVVRASLYKPLADKDNESISRVLISAKKFFSKIGLTLCVYSVGLMFLFPLAIDHRIGYISTAVLVAAVALSSVSQYMFGIVNQLLLTADQRAYVHLLIACITMILNTIISVVLIKSGASIEIMKLGASIVLLIRPLLLKIYVDRRYSLNMKLKLTEEPIKQKWNGLTQHIANYVLKHADIVILTLFSTLENVSIYYIYKLVTNGLQQLTEILTTGMASLLGDMYAKNEKEKLNTTFSAFEWIIHTFVTLIYTIAGVLVMPFVMVYTKGITDVDYIVPVFAVLIIAANGLYCIRLPYNLMVYSAGHFKETQLSAIIEAVLNIAISVVLVRRFGLIGVVIGTLVAMIYRTCYLAWYLSNNILSWSLKYFIKNLLMDVVVILVGVFTTHWIHLAKVSYLSWIEMALKVSVIVFAESMVLNMIFFRNILKTGVSLMLLKNRH
jgi:O-antigen/teichoic acid export membrane protein